MMQPTDTLHTPKRVFRLTLWPTVMATIMVSTCFFLGVWQAERLVWKQGLIQDRLDRRTAPPVHLNDLPIPDWETLAFRRVSLTGRFRHDREMTFLGRDSEGRAGYHIVTPLTFGDLDHPYILVNRGWVSMEERLKESRPRDPYPSGLQNLTGLLRPGFAKSCLNLGIATPCFTPDNAPTENIWFWTDYPAIAQYVGSDIAPYVIEQDRAEDLMQRPKGGQLPLTLPNNHLQYTITWFAMAIAGTVIWFLFHWRPVTRPDDAKN